MMNIFNSILFMDYTYMRFASKIQLYIIRTKHPKYIQLIHHLLRKRKTQRKTTKKGHARKPKKITSRSS